MSGWSRLVVESLPVSGRAPGPVERWSVLPGEVGARVGGYEVSLARAVASEEDWERVCAALASQPVFRGPALDGRLPVEAARVFEVVGLPLVPPGWGQLSCSCSCAQWGSVCAHAGAVVAELGARADQDPFVLVRWVGGERAEFVARVAAAAARRREDGVEGGGDRAADDDLVGAAGLGTGPATPGWSGRVDGVPAPDSAAVFWSAPPLPPLPGGLAGTAARVRAAAPGALLDELPSLDGPG